ncbi:MAG: YhcH/YjgK/YiaL family protein, partial [Bacillota bacterium]
MIFDHISNKNLYRSFPELHSVLEYLSGLADQELPAPNTTLVPDEVYGNPVTLTTKPEAERDYEAHRNYIDVHYIIDGCEKIALTDIANLTTKIPYAAENDVEFFENAPMEATFILQKGHFLLCHPHEAHKVGIMNDAPCDVKKAVCQMLGWDCFQSHPFVVVSKIRFRNLLKFFTPYDTRLST